MWFKKIITILILFICVCSCDKDMHREKVVGVVKQIHEKVLAKVNGIPITISDFKKEEKKLPPNLRVLLKSKEKQKQFLDNLITKELLYQEAKKLKLENRRDIKEILKSYKKDLLINELIRTQIKANVQIKEKDAYKYYLKNKDKFYTSTVFQFYKYVFKDLTDAQNFLKDHDLTRCFNICRKIKESKKLNDIFNPNISSTLVNLKPDKFSEILWSKEGYVILKLIKKKKGKLKPFYKVKDEVYKILKENKEKELLNRYINVLKSSANIVVYSDNITVK